MRDASKIEAAARFAGNDPACDRIRGRSMISRREFIVLAGAGAIVSNRGLAPDFSGPQTWLHCVRDLGAAGRIGAQLQRGLGENVRGLCAESAARLDALAGDASPERLSGIVADDFRNGRTVMLEGVVLS